MPKPPTKFDRLELLRKLGLVYNGLTEIHSREQKAIGGKVPVGGGLWMDSFFKMEGIRGVMTALHQGKTLEYSVKFGQDVSSIAVGLWNKHREYQVHRWEKTAHDFIIKTVRNFL